MRILFVCPHFTPDLHAATGEVMTKLVESLAARGHELTVVTSLPWYKGHSVDKAWRGRPWRKEKTAWGRIIRVWPFPTSKNSIAARAAGFVGFTALASAAALTAGKHNVVMGMSPPLFLGDAAYLAAKRSKAPFVFNTQDIFPDVAVELGALTNAKVISLAKKYEAAMYRRSDAITVLSDDQAANVRAKISSQSAKKVHIIHNFVDLEKVQPRPKEGSYRRRHGLSGKFVVMYSGNVGLSQSFDLVRSAAEHWQHNQNIVFVINGEGSGRPQVDRWAQAMPNVKVVNFGPRREVSSILGAADVHLVLLKKGLSKSSTPSKLYGILAAGRPVLASVDEGCEVANVIERAGVGLSVGPEKTNDFLVALETLMNDQEQLQVMGKRARIFAEEWLSAEKQAEMYEQLFVQLCDKR